MRVRRAVTRLPHNRSWDISAAQSPDLAPHNREEHTPMGMRYEYDDADQARMFTQPERAVCPTCKNVLSVDCLSHPRAAQSSRTIDPDEHNRPHNR